MAKGSMTSNGERARRHFVLAVLRGCGSVGAVLISTVFSEVDEFGRPVRQRCHVAYRSDTEVR